MYPACEGEQAAKTIYGMIGVAVFVTVKYFIQASRNYIRICGTSPPDDNEAALQASILRTLPAMMPELTRLMRDHESR